MCGPQWLGQTMRTTRKSYRPTGTHTHLMHIHMLAHTHSHTCVHTGTRTCTPTHLLTLTHALTHTHLHTHAHILTHTLTPVHTHAQPFPAGIALRWVAGTGKWSPGSPLPPPEGIPEYRFVSVSILSGKEHTLKEGPGGLSRPDDLHWGSPI